MAASAGHLYTMHLDEAVGLSRFDTTTGEEVWPCVASTEWGPESWFCRLTFQLIG